jgi:hypothetical protein
VLTSPSRTQQSYRHEAFLWRDAADFTAGLLPFVREGLEAEEPVMVAVIPEHTAWLREALGSDANQVLFADMATLGRNPARIIPAWQQFLDAYDGGRRPTRGVGEPIWPGRRSEELLECQLHEALLNVAVDPASPFWLVCPYDSQQLTAEVLEEAHRSHPVILQADSYSGSGRYAGRAHVESMFAAELTELPDDPVVLGFTAADVDRMPSYLTLELHVAGLSADRSGVLAKATHRLAQSSLHRGAPEVRVKIWRRPDALIVEVSDDTHVTDLLHGRRVPYDREQDGLWLANRVCDLVQMRSAPGGTPVRAHAWSSGARLSPPGRRKAVATACHTTAGGAGHGRHCLVRGAPRGHSIDRAGQPLARVVAPVMIATASVGVWEIGRASRRESAHKQMHS